ncbi:hypothetical protein GX441_02320 [bacterium]|nr:hypothetical protein [bacterium]
MKNIVGILASIPVLLFGIDLTEYKVPKTSGQVLSTGVNYHFGMIDGSVVSHFGNFSLNFERFQADIPWSYDLNLFGNLYGNFLPKDTASTDSTKQINYQVQWQAKYNRYIISGMNLLAFGKLDGDITTAYDLPATRATIGIGYGRFVNSTPLLRALRIEEEMLKQGVLVDSMPTGTLLKFAGELSSEAIKTYKEKYYYWEKEYYSALERILKESNYLKNSELGSAGSLIVKDIMEEYMSPRYYGYEANLGVGYDLLPAYTDAGRAAFASVSFDYSRPLGLRSQLIEKSNLRLPFTGGKFGNEIHGSLLVSASYEMNSVDLIGTYQLKADRVTLDNTGNYTLVLQNQINGTVAFVLVDRLIMSNSITLTQSTLAQGLSAEFSSTLSYRFF